MPRVTLPVFSPSLRDATKPDTTGHRPLRVGACFEELDQLPIMLVRAAVGCKERAPAMCVYRQLSKEFRLAVNEAVREWCVGYDALKREYLQAWAVQDTAAYFCKEVELRARYVAAFGDGVNIALGLCISRYTPEVYEDVLRDRCSICKCEIGKLGPAHYIRSPGGSQFTFTHAKCERRHTVSIPIEELTKRELDTNRALNFCANDITDRAYAVVHQAPFADRVKALAGMSAMTQSHNRVCSQAVLEASQEWGDSAAHRSLGGRDVVLWVAPHRLVELEDTLFSMCGVCSGEDENRAIAAAMDKRREVRAAAARVRDQRERHEKAATRQREASVRLHLAMSKLPWATPSAVAAYSPFALAAIGYDSFVAGSGGYASANVASIVRRLTFLHDVFKGLNCSQQTIDFFLDDSDGIMLLPTPTSRMNTPYWESEVHNTQRVARDLEAFGAGSFTIESLKAESNAPPDATVPIYNSALSNVRVHLLLRPSVQSVEEELPTNSTRFPVRINNQDLYRLWAATGLTKTVDLDAAMRAEIPSPLYDAAARTILGKALGTAHRSHVMQMMRLKTLFYSVLWDTE